jgi:hypothetical protein
MFNAGKGFLASSLLLWAGSAMAADIPPKGKGSFGAQALGGVSAPNVRLAAFISNDGSFVRSKGVASVTHPKQGVYCIKPNFSVNVSRIIPSITPEWNGSPDFWVTALYQSNNIECPGAISVYTLRFNFSKNAAELANEAFTIIVP